MLSAIYFICLDTKSWDWTDGYGGTGNLKSGSYQFQNGKSTSVTVATDTQPVQTMAAAATAANTNTKTSTAGAAQVAAIAYRRKTGIMEVLGFGLAIVEWLIL